MERSTTATRDLKMEFHVKDWRRGYVCGIPGILYRMVFPAFHGTYTRRPAVLIAVVDS